MIKLKASPGELNEFVKFVGNCIQSEAKSIDTVKEFYLTWSLKELNKRIIKKIFTIKIENPHGYLKLIPVTIFEPEVIALSIYFARHEVHPFLKRIENNIIKQIPAELVQVLKPLETLNTNDYDTDFSDY